MNGLENIKPGLSHCIQLKVGEKDSAAYYGSGMVDVFATPAMIALMEKTALECVLPGLPEGFNTVGTEIHVKHVKATPLGMQVRCTATLVEVDGKRLLFEIEAHDEQGLIGIGQHWRYIIDTAKFMERLK